MATEELNFDGTRTAAADPSDVAKGTADTIVLHNTDTIKDIFMIRLQGGKATEKSSFRNLDTCTEGSMVVRGDEDDLSSITCRSSIIYFYIYFHNLPLPTLITYSSSSSSDSSSSAVLSQSRKGFALARTSLLTLFSTYFLDGFSPHASMTSSSTISSS